MVDLAASVWRNFVTDGVPASGPYKVPKSKIREWGVWLESLASLSFTSGKVYSSKADLFADLVPAANTPALVIGDDIVGQDGLYMKVGATTTGSWTQLTDFVPGAQTVHAVDAGAGTPNAIIATTSVALSASGSQIVRLDVFEANTSSPVTITFNDSAPLTIKSAAGNDIVAGGLAAGPVLGVISGVTFRLLSDLASAAIQAAAEDAASDSAASALASEAARDIAAGYASAAVSQGNVPVYSTAVGMSAITLPVGLLAFETRGYNAADDAGAGLYAVRASEPSHIAKVACGGGLWGELIVPRGEVTCETLGLVGDNLTDNGARWPGANAYCQANGYRLIAKAGTYRTSVKALVTDTSFIRGAGMYDTVFKAIGAIDAVFHANTAAQIFIGWEDFQIDGNSTATDGANFDGSGGLILQGSYFRNIRGVNAVRVSALRGTVPMYSSTMQGVFGSGGKYGIWWEANACLNDSKIIQPRISNTTITGLHLKNTGASIAEVSIDTPDIEGNFGAGMYINNMRAKVLGVTHLEQNGKSTPTAAVTLAASPFATTNASAVVTVAHTAHGLATGDEINLKGATAVAGLTLNGKFRVTVVDAHSYTIQQGAAQANATTTGGGSAVVAEYTLPIDVLVDSHDSIATEVDFDKLNKSTNGAGQTGGVFARHMSSNTNITIRGGNVSRSNVIDGNNQSTGCNINLPHCLAGTVNASSMAVRRDENGIQKTGRMTLGTSATATGISANSNGWVRVTATKRSVNTLKMAEYRVLLDNAGDSINAAWAGPNLPATGFEDFVTFSVVSSQLMATRTAATPTDSDGWMTLEGEWREF
ncbi:hypothetical protein [Mesorhizobium sp. AA22]|uniref:hypothetical protein n=1 Tax=Mesorhizobium sp. AA22 TaxID=1854057 RepID=UPI0007EDBEF8|nr:hypothetical protein [Mesorhizobium sp. AA22]QIA23090.1 hypothetical protein A9K68_015905 [Mesorhizobium sp. AA22]